MLISAKKIKHPRIQYRCSDCNGEISGEYIIVFGYAHSGENPFTLKVCLQCAMENQKGNYRGVERLRTALELCENHSQGKETSGEKP